MMRIRGKREKYVLREAMKGLLPKVLYEREKFAFMAPPAHTDPKKWSALKALAERYLSPAAIADAGVLDILGVEEVFATHESPDATGATQNRLDAVINHLLGVQILHESFIAANIPRKARALAEELGWRP
jgi:asparagine synthase (glutamine-hydrolysing)